MRINKKISLAFLILLAGCGISFSTGSDVSDTVEQAPSEVEMERGVELIWEIPATPVTKYNIYFGESKDSLQLFKTVSIAELQRFRHDSFGPVFRYVATGLAKRCGIYVAIEAENQAGKSPMTPATMLNCN